MPTKLKYKFGGNRFTSNTEGHTDKDEIQEDERNIEDDRPRPSNSSSIQLCNNSGSSFFTPKRQKLSLESGDGDKVDGEEDNYFVLAHFGILKEILYEFLKCPDCGSKVELSNNRSSRMGFANKFKIHCYNCSRESQRYLSKQCYMKEGQGRNFYEVNVRMVMAFREIGKGHHGLENFARCANIHGISSCGYQTINERLYDAYESAAECSKNRAASEVRDAAKEEVEGNSLCRCSLDGSWQKRGHSSCNGIVTAIADGKCIDSMVYSKKCKACQRWEQKKGTAEYDLWKSGHCCSINHEKSSGAMEAAGAIEIFCSSVDKHKLIYKEYVGDGDTSSFSEVVNAKPYDKFGITPIKLECIGHVQKRLGNRLRNLRLAHKGTKTPLSGRGKLTDKVINSMQNYFGLAIRQNKQNLYEMKKAVGAILWHCTDFSDEKYRHRFCPSSENSWCKWRQDERNHTSRYRKNINLPVWIHDLLKPVFQELSRDELLSKCLHGQTQNCNESLNSIVWSKCPKNIFVQRQVLEMGVNSAVIEFNDGPRGLYNVLEYFKLEPGYVTQRKSVERLRKRINLSIKKQSENVKLRRKILRSLRKGYSDKEKEKEGGDSYAAGAF